MSPSGAEQSRTEPDEPNSPSEPMEQGHGRSRCGGAGMRYMTFGRRTGLRVSEFALGTANFGSAWGGGAERSQARAIFEHFADSGGTFVDTADCYNYGEAESMVGDFVRADRDHFVVSSKFAYGDCEHPRVSDTGN